MTVTESPPVADVPPPAPPARRWRLIAAICAAVAVVAIAVAAFALIRDNGNGSSTIATRDVAATRQAQQACQQWFDGQSGSASSAAPGWCGYMGDWMYQQMASGRTGSMMWGNPTAMYDTCVAAMGSYQPRVGDPATWCRSMVDWMRDHASDGDWGGWMMHPSMMGR